jgi:PAS domain S-box-containing protein
MQRVLSAEELSLVFRSITEYAIFTLDPQGRVTLWNEGAERVFGYSAGEMLGAPTSILFTPEDRARGADEQEIRDAVATGRAADERYHLRKDGSRFYASGVLFPVRDTSGAVTGFVKVCRDLSDRKRKEDVQREEQATLEGRVADRTRELATELAERRAAEQNARLLLSRLITLQEEERRRIARDLHDHLGQQVTALHLQFAALKKQLGAEGSEALARLEDTHAVFTQLDKDLDFFTWELRPGALYNLGLVAALTDFVGAFAQNYELRVSFESVGVNDGNLHQDVEINLYRIAQEALNNVYKHAKASRADVLLQQSDGRVILTFSDDGVGFAADEQSQRGPLERGLGLLGMKERATLLGGAVEIESTPGQGTSVIAIVPAIAPERRP